MFILTCFVNISFAQTICDIATPLCSNEDLSGNPPSGNPGGTINGGCRMLQAENVTWYVVRIMSGTTFTFMIDPDGPDDYDFAVWKNPNCNNIGVADRASYAAPTPYNTGLSMTATDTCETADGDGFVKYLDVQPGDIILIAIDKYNNNADGFTLIFDNADNAELDCTILGDSYGKCDVDENQEETFVASDFLADLNTDFPGSQFEFYYTKPNAESGTGTQVSFPHTVNVAGNPNLIFARVENSSGGFIRAVQISLFVNPLPALTSPITLDPVCDRDGDGEAEFDLTLAEPDLVADPSLYSFKYYVEENDAILGSDNFINPSSAYLSGNTTLYVRVETGAIDGNEDGCFSVGQINLSVTAPDIPTFDLLNEYCIDEIPNLLQTSLNNIDGTWSPSVIDVNNYEPQSYVFTPDSSECAEDFEIEITILEETIPEFSLEENYCLGATPPELLETSENGIEGTWSPTVIDSSVPNITTYKFTPNDPNCVAEFEIEIEVAAAFELDNTLSIELCDSDFDGNFEYNLTLLNEQLINDLTGLDFSYYANLTDYNNGIEIPENQLNNYLISLPTSIFVTATTADGCRSEYVEVNFIEGQSVSLLSGPYEIPFCEGEPINLTLTENTLYTSETGIDYTYYNSREDAEVETGAISDITNYTQAEVGSSLFVRIDKEDGSKCSEIVEVIFIQGQSVSLLGGPYEIPFCEGEPINLTLTENTLYTSETGVDFTYYNSREDAETESGAISDITNYTQAEIGSSLFVRIDKIDGSKCSEIVEVMFIAGEEVQYNPGPFSPMTYCVGETINITDYTSGIPNESDVSITYFTTEQDAQQGLNPIPDETAFAPQGNGTIYIKLEKTNKCSVILPLTYELLPTPELIEELPAQLEICEGIETIDLSVQSDDPNASFEWSWGNNQTLTGSEISITESGIYTLTITGENGCINTKQIEITTGSEPTITSIESGSNFIIVDAEPGNGGELEYSLNGVLWQSNPRFDNLNQGDVYTIYVRENGCLMTTYQTSILNVPSFISPNGDGINDVWLIQGIEATPDASLKIFNRYGKMFVDTNFSGNYVWDGKYGGRSVSSGEYWYIIEIPSDGIISARKFVGYISVRN